MKQEKNYNLNFRIKLNKKDTENGKNTGHNAGDKVNS